MRIYKPVGSKDRFVEMFQNVNKIKLNEGLYEAGSPNLNADTVLNMAYNQLKNNGLNIEHSNTQATGEENFVELLCTDKQGNNITFVFKVQSTEGDQEGVYNVSGVILNSFSYDSADGEETIDLAEDGLNKFNQQHGQELFDVVNKYIDVEEPAETDVQEAVDLIDAIKQDSYPFGGGDDRMQTGKNYGDEKPTNDAVRVKSPELDQFVQEGDMKTSSIFSVSNSLKKLGIRMLDIIDKPEINTIIFKLKYGGKSYNASVNKDEIDSIDNVSEILKNKLGISSVSETLQTGKAYADEKPTNPDVRAKSPELDQFVQEEQSVNEFDKPAMKLIQQAPGGATAGGVKQLEEKMELPIMGVSSIGGASVNEVDIVGEPKPPFPVSTKSPVDDLPPEKKKVIMDAINNLTVKRGRREYAPSANEINDEILKMRNQPSAVKEDWEDDILHKGAEEFEKRVGDPVVIDRDNPVDIQQVPEPEEEPIPEVSPEKRKIILQAEENLMAKNIRNTNYSPTITELLDEIDKIEGKVKPIKKFRSVSQEAEPYLSEIGTAPSPSPYRISSKDMEQIFDRIDPNSNIKTQVIQAANEFVDTTLGVQRFQMPPEKYKQIVKNVAVQMYMAYLERIAVLNEEEEKNNYPDPLGKKFKPKKHYPHKKKKLDTSVKLTEEENYTDDDDEPVLPVDAAAKRAQMQARSDISKDLGGDAKRPIGNYDTKFQFDMAEDLSGEQPSTGEELLKKEYENLRQNETFEFLSDAYISLLGLSREFRDDKKIQVSLTNIRDSIVEYLNMSDIPITQQGVQDFFENSDLEEGLSEDKEPGAEIPETDPDATGPDITPEETPTDDGMSHEPEGDKIEQLAQDKEEQGEVIQGGKGDGKSPLEFDPEQILMGLKVEKEHTDDPLTAIEIVMDHLTEDPEYYTQKDTPEASAQAGASADASNGEEKSRLPGVDSDDEGNPIPAIEPNFKAMGLEPKDNDKEMTDRLLGFKPHNVGDEVEPEKELGESTTVSDEKDRFQAIVNTPRPETPLVKEDLGFSEKDLKDRDPASWHQLQIAKKTLQMPDAMVGVMGGMTKEEAKEILRKYSVKGIQEIVAGKKSKAFRIGEYAVGGIIKVDINGPMIRIEALDFNSKRPVKGEDFAKDDVNGMDNYLNELTSSFYAGKVMEWIKTNLGVSSKPNYFSNQNW
jgi:hypothetical protein